MPEPGKLSFERSLNVECREYGKKEVFERRLNEGYREAAFGAGSWIGDVRIVRLWVFYHPEGKIATYEHPKFMRWDGFTVRGERFEMEYTESEFQKHQQEFKLKVGAKTDLASIVNEWE